ncbi:MAG: thermonuclease [Calditrichaeota bacterium]|nr:thermonuclease [Calditrichota bacterium]
MKIRKNRSRMDMRLRVHIFSLFVGAIIGVSAALYLQPSGRMEVADKPIFKGKTAVSVARVVDGDTVILLLEGKEHRVRLLGVDTPESVKPDTPPEPGGVEAGRFLKNLLNGEKVYVEYEAAGKASKDRYGRDLAYLYRAPDGLFVNQEIVRQGYGRVYRQAKFKYRDEFIRLEATAKAGQKGMWAEGG